MPIVYLETNYLLSVAEGRSTSILEACDRDGLAARFAIPSACILEALSVLVSIRKKNAEFVRSLDERINQVRRDRSSTHAVSLLGNLEAAKLANGLHLNDLHTRLNVTLVGCLDRIEFVEVDPDAMRSAMESEIVENDPTDNLILHCILHHARSSADGENGFLSGNSRDFGTPTVRDALNNAGLKYFREPDDVLAWLRSLIPPDPSRGG